MVPHDDVAPRKARLHCPDCGHASPVDGDWRVRDAGELRCPDCDALVTDRSLASVPSETVRERSLRVA